MFRESSAGPDVVGRIQVMKSSLKVVHRFRGLVLVIDRSCYLVVELDQSSKQSLVQNALLCNLPSVCSSLFQSYHSLFFFYFFFYL